MKIMKFQRLMIFRTSKSDFCIIGQRSSFNERNFDWFRDEAWALVSTFFRSKNYVFAAYYVRVLVFMPKKEKKIDLFLFRENRVDVMLISKFTEIFIGPFFSASFEYCWKVSKSLPSDKNCNKSFYVCQLNTILIFRCYKLFHFHMI